MTDFKPSPPNKPIIGISDEEQAFSISRLNFVRHVFSLILTVLLCFSLLMSELSQSIHSHHIAFISKMTPIYILLIAFSAMMAIKAIVSVKRIKVKSQGLEINNLFWHEKLSWSELKFLRSPKNLKYSWLRTKKSFYLFIKPEFERYVELEASIGEHLAIKS